MTTPLASAPLITAAEGHDSVLLPPLSELIVGFLAFGLLVGFFFWKIYPQIKKTYEARTERIEGGLARAEQAQTEAQALLEQYRVQLADARSEAARIREDAHAQGRQIVDELRAEAQREVEEIKARADAQLAADRAQTVAQLRREVGEIAVDLASKIVAGELANSAPQRRLVDDFISELDGRPATPAGSGG